jgi:gluconate 5-dehydrogenase
MSDVLSSFRLDGRVALVSDALDDIGQQVALALGEAGATIALTAGGTEAAAAGDALAVQVIERYGHIDILVNNLSASTPPAAPPTAESWRADMTATLDRPFFLTHAVGVHMIERNQGGRIINIAPFDSEAGSADEHPLSHLAADTSAGAVANFTRALATMLAPHRVLVNCIVPVSAARGAEDVKGIALYLASSASAYVTGQVITVNLGGGLHDRL